MAATAPAYSSAEELIHALTAGLGIIACVVAIPWLAWVSAGDAPRMVAALIFGCSALAMFITSVIYHSARQPDRKLVLRKFDHAAIYLLIAGTYTPVTLVAMRDAWGWVLFASVWALAAFGIIAKTAVGFRFPRLSIFLYLGMGWLGVDRIQAHRGFAERRRAGAGSLAGGLVYTAGVPFYIWKSRRYTHAVWHLFVLGGVACHFAAVLSLVTIPAG